MPDGSTSSNNPIYTSKSNKAQDSRSAYIDTKSKRPMKTPTLAYQPKTSAEI